MFRAGLFFFAALLAARARAAGPPPQEQWILVVAPAFRAAADPLIKHRQAQGMRVVVVDSSTILTPRALRDKDPGKLRARLRQLCRDHSGPSYILLLGSVAAGMPGSGRTVVPALSGTIGRMKGEPTDGGYGCQGDTRLPASAVGRLPARTEAEARAMVQKTLRMERDPGPGAWKRRLTVLAGIPAYNAVVDRLVENIAIGRFDRIHPIWSGRAVYTNPQSRFCLPDSQLRARSLDYLSRGQAFTLYLGHSNAAGLYGGPTAAFLDRADWAKVAVPTGAGVFITYGCNGCQLKGREGEGYGVAAIRNPQGPVAVLGSHGICFAAMVQLAADGLFARAFQGPLPRRLGPCWLAMLEGVAKGKINFLTYRMLDTVDGDSRIPQAVQREEHLEMFVLLGDPALRLPAMSADVRLDKLPALAPDKTFRVTGRLPPRLHGASVRVTLERSPASLPEGLLPLPAQPGAERDRVMLKNHERANRFVVAETEATARGDRFAVNLQTPAKLPGASLLLRVYARTEKHESMVVERVSAPRP